MRPKLSAENDNARRWTRIALVVGALVYDIAKAGVALFSGIRAGSIALLMVPWIVREGIEGLRGDACGCESGEARGTNTHVCPAEARSDLDHHFVRAG